MRKFVSAALVFSLAGCAFQPQRDTLDLIDAELGKAAQAKPASASSNAVQAALLPPLRIEVPKSTGPVEERFSIALNNVPAAQFFMGIASGTRYSMLVHPDVSGTISVNLKNVTLVEALDAVRELYGYDYKVEGSRIYVKPITLQTRVFQVNYLTGSRKGTSDTRVISGSVSDAAPGYPGGIGGQSFNPSPIGGGGATSRALDTSKISTTSTSDFWAELKSSLEAIVGGGKEGRSVVISPQSGVVVVRAMWDELRNVQAYLKAAQLSVDRQVILDAKIIEVELNNGFQSGINWAAFRDGNTNISAGMISSGSVLQPTGTLVSGNASVNAETGALTGQLQSAAGQNLINRTGNSLFGMAFQTGNFAALLSFLETQGNVHVLSSPRIATLNNQKAVLKVGRDEFFVTNVSTTTTAFGNNSSTTPSVTVQPFFSGVALDVTPQIDDAGNIILHIHPSVSNVTTVEKPINLGTAGSIILPLASSAISETDSVVRGKDGQVVAIGGLMRQASVYDRSQLPGAGSLPVLGTLFGNTNRTMQKRELVILLKPTIVQGNTWSEDVLQTQQRIQGMAGSRNPLD